MRTTLGIAAALCVWLVAGCGGGGGDATGGTGDHDSRLIGRWQLIYETTSNGATFNGGTQVFVFNEDGTFLDTDTSGSSSWPGTWDTSKNTVHIVIEGAQDSMPYTFEGEDLVLTMPDIVSVNGGPYESVHGYYHYRKQ